MAETCRGGQGLRYFALLRNGSETGLGICVFWILGGYFESDRMQLWVDGGPLQYYTIAITLISQNKAQPNLCRNSHT